MLRASLVLFLGLSALTGIVYPALVMLIGRAVFPHQAEGSLIDREGRPLSAAADGRPAGAVGSALLGQEFALLPPEQAARWLWGRPSATAPTPYTAFNATAMTGSSGSNFAPSNPALVDAVRARIDALAAADRAVGVEPRATPMPADLVTSSASGLDPHVSPAAAEWQVERIAKARGLGPAEIRAVIADATEGRALGIFGEPVVHVVRVNLALERLTKSRGEPAAKP
jgi:K+-transporting ATPase ATPase C chain